MPPSPSASSRPRPRPAAPAAAWLGACLLAAAAAGQQPPSPPAVAAISVPPEYEVTVAAAPPLVRHPLMANFDDRGRLYIAESAGENLRAAELEQRLPNFVRRLEDSDGDGVFDRSTIFADKLTLPQGALWHDGAVYVAAPPVIWRLVDEDDDGVADTREQIVDAFGYTGNAASIHGCFLGPAGRIYWCDGRHGHEVRRDGRLVSSGKAARIFSCRSDGSDFRVHCGGGMDNPVEIDFTPAGEMLGTVNLFYRQRGDCLVHWMHGGVYPRFDQQCVEEFPRTGDLLPEVRNLGHVAVSGMTRLRGPLAEQSGGGGRWLITEFNSHRVVEAELSRQGGTFVAEVRELLRSSSDDFHPTDVLQDADGSVLVVDTGGWFRIGCPTSQIAKPNILGAIYRIRRRDAEPPADPRGLQLDWETADAGTLVRRLDDGRFAVRRRAAGAIGRLGDKCLTAIEESPGGDWRARRQRVWALARAAGGDAPAVRRALAGRLDDPHWQVRLAAAAACGTLGVAEAAGPLAGLLQSSHPPLRRSAATALGQLGAAQYVPHLLAALRLKNDRVTEHALIYALLDIGDGEAVAAGLASDSPSVRRGALIALDQSDWEGLRPRQVALLVNTDDFALRKAAVEAIARRPGWSDAALSQLQSLLEGPPLDQRGRQLAAGLLVSLSGSDKAEPPLAAALADSTRPPAGLALLLESLAAWPSLTERLAAGVAGRLEHDSPRVVRAAIEASAAHPRPSLAAGLQAAGRRESLPVDVRVAALQAFTLSARRPLDEPDFEFLGAQLRGSPQPLVRLAAARALGQSLVDEPRARRLAEWAETAGPLELPSLTPAWQQTPGEAVGLRVIAALRKSPGAASLTVADIESLLAPFPPSVIEAAEPLLADRRAAAAGRRMRLVEHLKQPAGDPRRGRVVFHSRTAGCVACHRVAGAGGDVGPDLSTIGQRRSRRDLLEAVLYPSASQARGFESHLLRLHDGRQLAGLVLGESGGRLRLRTTDQRDVSVPRAAVEAMKPSEVSVMPGGLENTMTTGQLQDLVAYLQSLQGKAAP